MVSMCQNIRSNTFSILSCLVSDVFLPKNLNPHGENCQATETPRHSRLEMRNCFGNCFESVHRFRPSQVGHSVAQPSLATTQRSSQPTLHLKRDTLRHRDMPRDTMEKGQHPTVRPKKILYKNCMNSPRFTTY